MRKRRNLGARMADHRTRAGGIGGTAAVLIIATAGSVSADEYSAAPATTEVTAQMYYSGIDVAQAESVGNEVVYEDGDQILIDGETGEEILRIPYSTTSLAAAAGPFVSSGGVATPTGTQTRTGDCGSSTVAIYNDSQSDRYRFSTSWTSTSGPAFDFTWAVTVRANWGSGTYQYVWGDVGPLALRTSWTSGTRYDFTDAPYGTNHTIWVSTGIIYLTNGGVCTSAEPIASAVVH